MLDLGAVSQPMSNAWTMSSPISLWCGLGPSILIALMLTGEIYHDNYHCSMINRIIG